MRFIIALVLALFAAAGIAWMLRGDPGYALVSIGSWTVETSVAFMTVFLLAFFALFYLLVRLLVGLWRVPSQARAASQSNRRRRAHRLLTRGIAQLLEGRWKTAEISLMKGAQVSSHPGLYYIGAAWAARRLGAQWRSEGYFHKADQFSEPEALVMKLAQAELLLEDGRAAEARDMLQPLLDQQRRQPRTLELLSRSYEQLEEWENLRGLFNDLHKSRVLDETRYTDLQRQTYQALLAKVSRNGSLSDLQSLWRSLPESLRAEEALMIDYAGYLRDHDAADDAEALLRGAINRHWSDHLAVGYGQIGRGNLTAQLNTAESWLEEHRDNPHLLLTCGRLAKRSRQLEKARGYLEKSIAVLPTPDAFQALGEILEETGDLEEALRCYRTSLQLLSGHTEAKQAVAVIDSSPALSVQTSSTTPLPPNVKSQGTAVGKSNIKANDPLLGNPSQSAAS